MLGLRKSYRDACQANKAIGLFFATLFLLTQVNIVPAQAKAFGDHNEPSQLADGAIGDSTVENQALPLCKFAHSALAKPISYNALFNCAFVAPALTRHGDDLLFAYSPSKFATFDLKHRKSRDPPTIIS